MSYIQAEFKCPSCGFWMVAHVSYANSSDKTFRIDGKEMQDHQIACKCPRDYYYSEAAAIKSIQWKS